MKVRIIRNCAVGGQHREAGSIVEVDRPTAIALTTLNRAVLVDEIESKEEPKKVAQRDPQVEQRDPETAPRTRKGKANG